MRNGYGDLSSQATPCLATAFSSSSTPSLPPSAPSTRRFARSALRRNNPNRNHYLFPTPNTGHHPTPLISCSPFSCPLISALDPSISPRHLPLPTSHLTLFFWMPAFPSQDLPGVTENIV